MERGIFIFIPMEDSCAAGRKDLAGLHGSSPCAREAPRGQKGDTTGCGDNFVGGLLASLALQLEAGQKRGAFDIIDACSMAIVSGGLSCFYLGGTYLEEMSGEKRRKIEALYGLYLQQLSAGI